MTPAADIIITPYRHGFDAVGHTDTGRAALRAMGYLPDGVGGPVFLLAHEAADACKRAAHHGASVRAAGGAA